MCVYADVQMIMGAKPTVASTRNVPMERKNGYFKYSTDHTSRWDEGFAKRPVRTIGR
jgi:hypothetical protein